MPHRSLRAQPARSRAIPRRRSSPRPPGEPSEPAFPALRFRPQLVALNHSVQLAFFRFLSFSHTLPGRTASTGHTQKLAGIRVIRRKVSVGGSTQRVSVSKSKCATARPGARARLGLRTPGRRRANERWSLCATSTGRRRTPSAAPLAQSTVRSCTALSSRHKERREPTTRRRAQNRNATCQAMLNPRTVATLASNHRRDRAGGPNDLERLRSAASGGRGGGEDRATNALLCRKLR